MRSLSLFLCIFASVVISVTSLDPSWHLVFSDEFDGNSVDTTKWNVRTKPGNWGYGTTPNEIQHYDPSAVTVSNGNLVITASNDTAYWNRVQPYKSGWMDTQSKFSTTNGRVEFRAQMAGGNGMWPAIWMLSEQNCWPLGAEFDMMEFRGTYPNDVNGFYHYSTSCDNGPTQMGTRRDYISQYNLAQSFHVYAVEWTPTTITWYFDDIQIRQFQSSNLALGLTQFDPTPHYIIINSAVSGNDGFAGKVDSTTVFPNYLYVDYVRVYQKTCGSCSNHGCCDPNTLVCTCNAGWSGGSCEQWTGSFVDQFTSYHYEYSPNKDVKGNGYDNGFTFFSDQNVFIGGGFLNITVTNCPTGCGGQGYSGGAWNSGRQFSYGTFSFVAKGSNVNGTGFGMQATNQNGGSMELIEMLCTGMNPRSIQLTTWHSNYQMFQASIPLGFDASAGFHNYSFTYNPTSVLFYVDQILVFTATQNIPSGLLYMSANYAAQPAWFGGPFVFSGPSTTKISLASWSVAPSNAVCSTPAPTLYPPTCQPSSIGYGTGLTGDYFDGNSGSAWFVNYKRTAVDPTINFSWGNNAPATNVNPDYFSVRWTGQVQPLYSDVYTFYSLTDDGVRLYVNGVKIIDYWMNPSTTERTGTITLQAGVKYDIVLEYEETTGGATQILSWSSKCQPKQVIPQSQLYPCITAKNAGGNGLKARYYSTMTLQTLVRTQTDPTVNFDWGSGGPSALKGQTDKFSVQWSGYVQPIYSGQYTFYANSDDGERLYVNGQLIVDAWRDQSPTEVVGVVTNMLAGRNYSITYRYYENTGGATAILSWSNACQAKQVIPTSQLFAV